MNNNLIRELAIKAGYVSVDGAEFFNSLAEQYHKKFAELIVRECCNMLNEFGEDVENGDIFRSDENQKLLEDINSNHLGPLVWAASDQIKKHFGLVD